MFYLIDIVMIIWLIDQLLLYPMENAFLRLGAIRFVKCTIITINSICSSISSFCTFLPLKSSRSMKTVQGGMNIVWTLFEHCLDIPFDALRYSIPLLHLFFGSQYPSITTDSSGLRAFKKKPDSFFNDHSQTEQLLFLERFLF